MSVTGTTVDSWKEAGVAADFRRDGVRFSLVWDVLRDIAATRVAETGREALDIVDVGGGTGGLAVPFAALGHNVTVVDPSPDALAAAQRRAAEAGARLTAVLHRALAGRFAEARQLLEGHTPAEPPRRFTLPALTALIGAAGLRPGEAHGLRIFSGLVPGALLDGDAGGAGGTEALRALEAAAAATPPLRDIAAQLHVLGHR